MGAMSFVNVTGRPLLDWAAAGWGTAVAHTMKAEASQPSRFVLVLP
jgi:hypothetical protein